MEKLKLTGLPGDIVQDIELLKSILRRHGAIRIILYGSVARGDYRADSDLDLCFEGISDKDYFRAVAECLMETDRRASILDFKNIHGYLRGNCSAKAIFPRHCEERSSLP